jgi:hypothetical protein
MPILDQAFADESIYLFPCMGKAHVPGPWETSGDRTSSTHIGIGSSEGRGTLARAILLCQAVLGK